MTAGRFLGRGLALATAVLIGIALLVSVGWGALTLLFFDHLGAGIQHLLSVTFGVASALTLAAALRPAWRWRALVTYGLLFGAVLVAWSTLKPTNLKDWAPDVARVSYATIDGSRITLHDIRNFDYRSETDFTPAYYDRTFDLEQLSGVDLIASYWMGPKIAHIFLSFEFNGREHVAISIEARRARGEPYSSLQGFFRRFELIYVVADERDVIRLRTNYRRDPPEQVYLYRLRMARLEDARRLFLAYVAQINSLHDKPQFYNSLTTNCVGSIWTLSRVNPDHLPYSWKILLSGYVPELLYENERVDTSVPFAELQKRAHINARAQAADADPGLLAADPCTAVCRCHELTQGPIVRRTGAHEATAQSARHRRTSGASTAWARAQSLRRTSTGDTARGCDEKT